MMQQEMTPSATPPPATLPSPITILVGIRGMHCASCVDKIERSLKQTPGVVRARVNLANEEALAMALHSVSVVTNSLRLCTAPLS